MEQILITAHRGAMAHAPENSIKAFQLATAVGADEIELDVHASADGILVINHDDVVDRTTDGTGLIATKRWAELSKLHIHGTEPICTFDDVLEQVADIDMQIEVKDVHAIDPLLTLLSSDAALRERSTVTSFNAGIVEHVRSSGVDVRYARILGAKGRERLQKFIDSGVRHAMCKWPVIDAPLMEKFRSGGGRISVWECNDDETIRRAIDEGFHGLTTNDPELALAIRDGGDPVAGSDG